MARKPKVLTRLRVDEISLVDRGAGEGVSVLYSKRNRPRRSRFYEVFKNVDFSKLKTNSSPLEGEIEDINTGDDAHDSEKLPGQMEEFVTALQVANPTLSRQDAVRYLLHGAHGRATAQHIATTFKAKEPVMDRATELQSIVKSHGGIQAMAKLFVAANKSIGNVTEHEFTKLMHDEAQKTRQANERPDQAFARFYSSPESLELRKAIQICKSVPSSAPLMSFEPTQVGGADVSVNDSAKAYAQLTDMAEAMRAKSPDLTIAQCFARVFTDTANAALAAKAHRRPNASDVGNYPYPTSV
jgi:hypothetical protein